MFPRSCGTSGSHKKPAMQCQHAQKKLLGSLRLVRRTNHQGPCSMPSRAGAPSSIPTHCQRDQEREAHARSSPRDTEAACSAETGVKTHPPAQQSSNDTTACCESLLCTLVGRTSEVGNTLAFPPSVVIVPIMICCRYSSNHIFHHILCMRCKVFAAFAAASPANDEFNGPQARTGAPACARGLCAPRCLLLPHSYGHCG